MGRYSSSVLAAFILTGHVTRRSPFCGSLGYELPDLESFEKSNGTDGKVGKL
jgi:hypothetical protein